MLTKIKDAIDKFNLNLNNLLVLTEAATGNYACTPIISALAGAQVIAVGKASRFGSFNDILKITNSLASEAGVENQIRIVNDISEINDIDLSNINIVTNTGFVRPIDKELLSKLNQQCVIPLMWEPWEYRIDDLDLEFCYSKKIKVYGTNENDSRLETLSYLGWISLFYLLKNKLTPRSAKILLLGNDKFIEPVEKLLKHNGFNCYSINNYTKDINDLNSYNFIVLLEHTNPRLLLGNSPDSYLNINHVHNKCFVLHICGNVDLKDAEFHFEPQHLAPFGKMSLTTDFIDSKAVIDLHTAGLKVAEGMLLANQLNLKMKDYKDYMELNYPAKSFENKRYW